MHACMHVCIHNHTYLHACVHAYVHACHVFWQPHTAYKEVEWEEEDDDDNEDKWLGFVLFVRVPQYRRCVRLLYHIRIDTCIRV